MSHLKREEVLPQPDSLETMREGWRVATARRQEKAREAQAVQPSPANANGQSGELLPFEYRPPLAETNGYRPSRADGNGHARRAAAFEDRPLPAETNGRRPSRANGNGHARVAPVFEHRPLPSETNGYRPSRADGNGHVRRTPAFEDRPSCADGNGHAGGRQRSRTGRHPPRQTATGGQSPVETNEPRRGRLFFHVNRPVMVMLKVKLRPFDTTLKM
jgi:hypothetical protein